MTTTTSTSPPQQSAPAVRVRMLRIVLTSRGRIANVVLDSEPVELGREGHVRGPLALSDTEVSRHHATIERAGDQWVIVDRGSHNGTFVDGDRVERAPLAHGTVIRAGKTLLVYLEADLREDERLAVAPGGSRIVGDSMPAMRLHAELELVAPQPVAVLIQGETGVGKELVAEEIHRRSRRPGAFIAVNCAAIARELAESELFGHVPGAFTGAARSSDGLFAAAERGTLFLDEVGELPSDLQPKLLRALATGEVRAVGSAVARKVDVRVVAATLRDLDAEVRQERFRADLLNRLAGWRITVAPLRERRDDVLGLASAFLSRHGRLALSADAAEALLLHDWPGNVRELERTIAAAAVRAAAAREDVELKHLPAALAGRLRGRATTQPTSPVAALVPSGTAIPTREELAAVLERMEGNVARVADYYSRDRHQIYRWARRYGLDLESFRRDD